MSWHDILNQVKKSHKPGQPVQVTESLLGAMSSATTPPITPQPAKVEPLREMAAAVPGDGADPTSAANHDVDQHIVMNHHTALNQHLMDIHTAIARYKNAAASLPVLHSEHEEHLANASRSIDHAFEQISDARKHLSRANQACLK